MQASLAAGLLAGFMTLAAPALAAGPTDCRSGPMSNASRTDGYSLKRILRIAGLTADGQLVCLDDRKPGKVRVVGNVGGFAGSDSRLIGIDYRPQDGLLYGVGNAGGLYQVDTATAQLTQVGALTVALDPAATAFDIDFNPAANALRIVGNTGQNLRQPLANLGTGNPLAATVEDSALNVNGVVSTGVVGAAYTNNDLSPVTGTTLFDLNATQVLLQSPPNGGVLAPTGSLTVTAAGDAGFDIYSVIRGDVTVAQRAFAALNVDGEARLYELNLLTGKATARSRLGAAVVDIAVPLTQY